MVDVLFEMAESDALSPHIPVQAWEWLNKRPIICPSYRGLSYGLSEPVVRVVQGLGDIDLMVSYLLVVFSKRGHLWSEGALAMHRLIREELSGIGLAGYRADLIHQLDYVLSQRGWKFWTGSFAFPGMKERYEKLRWELLEVDRGGENPDWYVM